MEMSQNEGIDLARDRMKREAGLQIRLAKRLYATEDAAAAMNGWTEKQETGPAALFRKYLDAHPETNLEAVTNEELDRILGEAGIRPVVH